MPSLYTQISLAQLQSQLSTLLDDPNQRYWTPPELTYSIQESLRYWGALTNYWRTRGSFSLALNTTWYDLSVQLPALRTRTWTLNQMCQEIQYHLLEAANGISGSGMSQQVQIANVLVAIQRARNQFVIDTHMPLTLHSTAVSPPPPTGTVQFGQASIFIHRVGWQDAFTGRWFNLWREDEWALDHANYLWTVDPDFPTTYSESSLAPLTLQLSPAPLNSGQLELLKVDALFIDTTNASATFNIPDEWIHAVKYWALYDLYSSANQLNDPMRAQYCLSRYKQSVEMAQMARSIQRMQLGTIPLFIDSMQAIDAANVYWRNQPGPPSLVGVLYDFLAVSPGLPDRLYGVTADVIQSAPIPVNPGDYIQVGEEDLPELINYCTHYLSLKMGGNNLKESLPQYDSFMRKAASRGNINAAKIRYLEPLFGQPQREEAARPDELMESAPANA